MIQVLDSVVIKLEGGTDFDLTVLDQPDEDETETSKETNKDKEKAKEKDGEKEEKSRKRKRDKTAEVTHSIFSCFNKIFLINPV